MVTRRALVAGSVASFALTGCARLSGGGNKVLRVGSQKGSTKSVVLASGALDGADYSVEWSEFAAAQTLLEAVGGGAIDLGVAGDAPFQFAYQSGSPIRAVGAQHVGGPGGVLAIVAPGSSSIRTLDDLRGKQIATGRGSIGHYLILRVLDRAGWPADAVKIVFLSPSDAASALAAGSVAAWSTWGPFVPLAQSQGARIVVEGKDYTTGLSFDVANTSAISGKSAILKDYLAREATALAWSISHQNEYAGVLAKETGLPLPIALQTVQRSPRTYTPIDDQLIEGQQTVLETFARAGDLGSLRPLSQAFVPGLVKVAG